MRPKVASKGSDEFLGGANRRDALVRVADLEGRRPGDVGPAAIFDQVPQTFDGFDGLSLHEPIAERCWQRAAHFGLGHVDCVGSPQARWSKLPIAFR